LEIREYVNELYLNGSNLTDSGINYNDGVYSMDGLGSYSTLCDQLNHYMIKMGIIVICVYLFFCWFNWWFFNYGYKKIRGEYAKHLDTIEKRIYWDEFIRGRITKFAIGYITVIVYLNWK